jgi:hypothetical protein
METLLPIVVPLSLTFLALVVASFTKIIIVFMVIRRIPPEHCAEVLRAATALSTTADLKRKQQSVDSG